MPNHPITSIQELHDYLRVAMELEHATIPPYLLALYTIRPDTNAEATRILRAVVVEEMLHLTLAANITNAVGGKVDLTAPNFVPAYPARLPDGEEDFTVSLRPFSSAALDTFLSIERPKRAPSDDKKMVNRGGRKMAFSMQHSGDQDFSYYSIGEFYQAIADGLKTLNDNHSTSDPPLFCGAAEKQVGPEFYYSGGAKLLKVHDLDTAITAVKTIIDQGEGFDAGVFNDCGELSHEYRFDQLKKGRYYLAKNANGEPDTAGNPTGPTLQVDWDSVFPAKVDAKLSDYVNYPELHAAAVAFNQEYFSFLGLLTRAFNGEPILLQTEAVPKMFALRNLTLQLVHAPLPGTAFHAAPTFEMPTAAAATQRR
jgi:hypothetical protein